MRIDLFDINEKIWYLSDQHKPQEAYVRHVEFMGMISEFSKTMKIIYTVDHYNNSKNSFKAIVWANRCFRTKEELINSL